MFGERNPEVLVAGAGPVGLFAALKLARGGVRVGIVDTGVWACQHSYALALHPQTLDLFAALGLEGRVRQAARMLRRIGVWDARGRRAGIDLEPGLAVLRQDAIESLLEDALREAGIQVLWRHGAMRYAQHAGGVAVGIDRYEKESRGYIVAHSEWVVAKSATVDVPFVIAADGYDSPARRALNCEFPAIGPAEYYAVFETPCDEDLGDELRLTLGDGTADTLWPLPGGNCRWGFQLPGFTEPETEAAQRALAAAGFGDVPSERQKDRAPASTGGAQPVLDENSLRQLLAARAPWFQARLGVPVWRTLVRFERRLASAFGVGRVWLAGDAAHLTAPGGVQSMNLGLHEASALAGAITAILREGAPETLLADYNSRWQGVWRELHGLTGGLRAAAGADPWVAAHAAQLLACLPAHGDVLRGLAGQLSLTL